MASRGLCDLGPARTLPPSLCGPFGPGLQKVPESSLSCVPTSTVSVAASWCSVSHRLSAVLRMTPGVSLVVQTEKVGPGVPLNAPSPECQSWAKGQLGRGQPPQGSSWANSLNVQQVYSPWQAGSQLHSWESNVSTCFLSIWLSSWQVHPSRC